MSLLKSMEYLIVDDIKTINSLLDISINELASELKVDYKTFYRLQNDIEANRDFLERFYSFVFKNHIRLNEIKEMYFEETMEDGEILLFHGSKDKICGSIDLNKTRKNNDFGQGFYCGESFEQSASFVSSYNQPSVYFLGFKDNGLKKVEFGVTTEWMLAIAYYRGRLDSYKGSRMIQNLIDIIENVDYIVAPIADNRMFKIIDTFINGEITDEQCKHCLAATNLGKQYIFKTTKAIESIKLYERAYICNPEKEHYLLKRLDDNELSDNKVKFARIQYRGKGHYIDELLK